MAIARQFSKKHIIRALRKPTPPRAPPVLPRHIKLLFEARARAAVNEAEKKGRRQTYTYPEARDVLCASKDRQKRLDGSKSDYHARSDYRDKFNHRSF